MELNSYQREVMGNLSAYLSALNETDDLHKAWQKYWNDQDVTVGLDGVPGYRNSIKGVPHVCMKVPTGGGKTFMAFVQPSAVSLTHCRRAVCTSIHRKWWCGSFRPILFWCRPQRTL